MPWYYASSEAKPVGPVSLEQLRALRVAGTIFPTTYVIEYTGQPIVNWTWRRYSEVFPSAPEPLPLPAGLPMPPVPPNPSGPPLPPTPPAPTPGAAHPLFPSAAVAPTLPPSHPPAGQPNVYPYPPIKPTNVWCGWGFALGLIGFFFSFICIGFLPALLSLVLCIVGLVQIGKNPRQSGRGMAFAGLGFSSLALVIAVLFLVWAAKNMNFSHQFTVTEQTSSDSQ
jgi:hypothetical protein